MRIRERTGALVAEVASDEFRDPVLLEEAFQRIIEKLRLSTIVVFLGNVPSITSLGIAVLIAVQGVAMVHRRRIAFRCRSAQRTALAQARGCGPADGDLRLR